MKSIVQLITSFEQKARQDEYAIVSKSDLQTAANLLTDYQQILTDDANTKHNQKVSLNSGVATTSEERTADELFTLLFR